MLASFPLLALSLISYIVLSVFLGGSCGLRLHHRRRA
jgi:hypothetical protein